MTEYICDRLKPVIHSGSAAFAFFLFQTVDLFPDCREPYVGLDEGERFCELPDRVHRSSSSFVKTSPQKWCIFWKCMKIKVGVEPFDESEDEREESDDEDTDTLERYARAQNMHIIHDEED